MGAEQKVILPIDPESVIYEWRDEVPMRIFALGRGDFEGKVFYYGFSHSDDLLDCQREAGGTVQVGVGVNVHESYKHDRIVFDPQRLGLWILDSYRPEWYRGFRRIRAMRQGRQNG